MAKTKLINADKEFIDIIRKKWPNIRDPERTRIVADRISNQDRVVNKVEEMLYGKPKKK